MRVLLATVLSLLAGCGTLVPAPSPYEVTDAELRARGEWTAVDARARQLIGAEQGALGYRGVRLVPWGRKLFSLKGAVETLVGFNYEIPYYYVARARAYVIPQRDRPAVILPEGWGEEGVEPEEATAEWAFTRLRHRLQDDLRELDEALHSEPAEPEPARPPVDLQP